MLVELRDAATAQQRVAVQAGILLRNGVIIDPQTGQSVLTFAQVKPGKYYVVLRHRNHLGVQTQQALVLSTTPVTVDFIDPKVASLGEERRRHVKTLATLWAGELQPDNRVIMNGAGNDAAVIVRHILTQTANTEQQLNYRSTGYLLTDLNLDGSAVYTGSGNDLNVLAENVFGHPKNLSFAANFVVKGGMVEPRAETP